LGYSGPLAWKEALKIYKKIGFKIGIERVREKLENIK
jgi:hypothetical protein